MKDLKHLLYFENLLQEAQNELILQAQSEGKVCVAYVCENTPEPLLNLPGAFSTRLRAPRTGSMEMATYYMTSFLCEYSRALLERAIEGGIRCWGVDANLFLSQCNQRSSQGYSEIQIDAGERVQLIPDIYLEIIA